MAIDEKKTFQPVNIAILTVSDTRTRANDTSGDVLECRIADAGHHLAVRTIITDQKDEIVQCLRNWINDPNIDVVISSGGTGLTGRDVTPEAFRAVFEKEIDGFSAVFHRVSFEKIGTSTVQSRACGGVANGTYLFALPGSPGAVKDGWDGILKSQLDSRHGPCNFIGIMPRLKGR
jgi:molybdenum cofactor biosynthesis protein B